MRWPAPQLADSGLTADEDQSPALGPGSVELSQSISSLERLDQVVILRGPVPRFNSEPD